MVEHGAEYRRIVADEHFWPMGTRVFDAHVEAAAPVATLSLAREFYEGVLGLMPSRSHRPEIDIVYEFAGGTRSW